MTLLGALVVLLHLRRRDLDFLHTYIPDVKMVNNAQGCASVPAGGSLHRPPSGLRRRSKGRMKERREGGRWKRERSGVAAELQIIDQPVSGMTL